MTYDELHWLTLMLVRRGIFVYDITPDEWSSVRADQRILNHVDYSFQALQFKINNVIVKVKR